MKNRPSFEEVYMEFAELISKRSTCKRLSVGTVITTTDYRKVLAVGYNGNASGLKNVCDRDEPGNCGAYIQKKMQLSIVILLVKRINMYL